MFWTFVYIRHLYCTLSRSFFPDTVYKRYANNKPKWALWSVDGTDWKLSAIVRSCLKSGRRLVAQCSKRTSIFCGGRILGFPMRKRSRR